MKHRIILTAAIALALIPTASATPDKRAESEKAIRKAAYEMMKAFLTQDIATFKRLTTKRTLDLIDLTYEAARRDPTSQQELQKANINTSEQFLRYFIVGMSNQYLQSMPLSPEAASIKVSNESTITFNSDSDARIVLANSGFARARLTARAWRIDLADWLKKSVLQEIKDPDLRARIQRL